MNDEQVVGADYWAAVQSGVGALRPDGRGEGMGHPTAGTITFRMALMTVDDGTPGTANAFLAWDRPVAAGGGCGLTIHIRDEEGVGRRERD